MCILSPLCVCVQLSVYNEMMQKHGRSLLGDCVCSLSSPVPLPLPSHERSNIFPHHFVVRKSQVPTCWNHYELSTHKNTNPYFRKNLLKINFKCNTKYCCFFAFFLFSSPKCVISLHYALFKDKKQQTWKCTNMSCFI